VSGTTPTPVVTFPPASQISDGQVQVSAGPAPASQLSDGQVQVTPGPAASVPGAQETVISSSVVVPTDAPLVNGAAGGIGGRVWVAMMGALGVVGVVWF
jgi:hypothetical protein